MTVIPPHDDPRASGRYDAGGKSAAEIEGDIEHTRAELGALVRALEARLAPRHLLEQGLDMVKDRMSGDGGIGDTLRANPVPLALVGAGMVWLLAAGASGDGTGELARRLGDRVSGTARAATERPRRGAAALAARALEAVSPATEAVAGLAGYEYARTKPRVGEAAAAAARRAGAAATRTCSGLRQAIEAKPLAYGVLGLLAGAALGLAIPRSPIERGWIGDRARRLADEAETLARREGSAGAA